MRKISSPSEQTRPMRKTSWTSCGTFGGSLAGVLMTRMSDSLVRVSLRSKNELDVSAIAGVFGGGGHRRAAGLRSDLPLPLLREKLILLIQQALLSK